MVPRPPAEARDQTYERRRVALDPRQPGDFLRPAAHSHANFVFDQAFLQRDSRFVESTAIQFDPRHATTDSLRVLNGNLVDRLASAQADAELLPARFDDRVDQQFLASDPAALLAHTREVIFLENGDLARLTLAGCEVWDRSGEPIERPSVRLNWDPIQSEKGGFKHFMLKEIHD